jgi:redox-sensing transcriptional repressor
MNGISDKVIGRLGVYRRLLMAAAAEGAEFIYSHDLASRAKVTAAQVRRDMMVLSHLGNPAKGYEIASLVQTIDEFLDAPKGQTAVLVGVGNLGRALLAFFTGRGANLRVVAAFDNAPAKVWRVLHGYRVYDLPYLASVVQDKHVDVGIITVPADQAQAVAETMVDAGIRGILNMAPAKLHLPVGVYVEDLDVSLSLERVAYMARHGQPRTEVPT